MAAAVGTQATAEPGYGYPVLRHLGSFMEGAFMTTWSKRGNWSSVLVLLLLLLSSSIIVCVHGSGVYEKTLVPLRSWSRFLVLPTQLAGRSRQGLNRRLGGAAIIRWMELVLVGLVVSSEYCLVHISNEILGCPRVGWGGGLGLGVWCV